ncbi:GNAT family N-acetyltransferase [Phytomonospora sp. NPDC050363]|uniref:GNAT family N-acetyltransferase n=1 Tax=Phytomonospora sp. NPDC050363 TaxID=3155642 RepID=UPI00340223BC
MTDIRLREVEPADLETFFQHESDVGAARMVGFTSREREPFMTHWNTKVLGNPENFVRAVLVDGELAGNILSWRQDGRRHLGYWFGREFWGRGVAGRGLELFLAELGERPLYAEALETNTGSRRLLERRGFTTTGDVNGDGYVTYVLEA